MKHIFKYFSMLLILLFALSGCKFIRDIKEEPVDPDYESGLTQQELFSYLNKGIGYREDKVDNYVYFSFYLDHKIVYSFSNEEIEYTGSVIDFSYKGKNHFEVSCQFDPEDEQNFTSFVKTFDIFFEELKPDRMEISFDGKVYKLINDTGYDFGSLLLALQLYKNYYIDFDDVSLYVGFHDSNQFYYDDGTKTLTGIVDNVTYLGKDVYDLNIKITDGENQYHNSFLLTYSSAYPERIFIELKDFGLVEMQCDKGYDTIEILTILTTDGPFEEIDGKNIRIFNVDNFSYTKTNSNGDYMLNGLITLFEYQGKGVYKMTVQFSAAGNLESDENKYNIEVIFEYDQKNKILKVREDDVSRMIVESYTFKTKK